MIVEIGLDYEAIFAFQFIYRAFLSKNQYFWGLKSVKETEP